MRSASARADAPFSGAAQSPRDLLADEHRVQRGHRLLEDHRDVRAADAAHGRRARRGQIDERAAATPQHHPAARDLAAAVLDEPHQRQRRDRLARARFADDRERLAAIDVERQVAHGVERRVPGGTSPTGRRRRPRAAPAAPARTGFGSKSSRRSPGSIGNHAASSR
jgi:hypothetical protein